MQNATGQEIDYDAFKSQFDANPQMKNLVDKFDADGITIKTKNKEKDQAVKADKDKSKSSIATSAKRAASNMLK